MGKTTIEWTRTRGSRSTWNPVRGCKKVSPGCDHCYAERFAERWRGVPGNAYEAASIRASPGRWPNLAPAEDRLRQLSFRGLRGLIDRFAVTICASTHQTPTFQS